MYTYVCVYIYIYIYVCIYTYIHIIREFRDVVFVDAAFETDS